MEWFIMNSSSVRSIAPGLVHKESDEEYRIHDECADAISHLLEKIQSEDQMTSVTKRHLLTERIVAKDLVPLIKYTTPNTEELSLALHLLETLCEPMERLPLSLAVLQDISSLTNQVRKAFLDKEFVSKLFAHIHELIHEAGEEMMATESYEGIKHLLLLVRNILYYSQKEDPIRRYALYGQLLKNNLGAILTYSIACHNKDLLVIPVSQVLSGLFQNFEWQLNIPNDKEVNAAVHADHFVNDQLKRVVVQLLQGSLATLTSALQRKELKEATTDSYIPWCLAKFLPYIRHVAVPISKIRGILSSKKVGYLVYQLAMLSINIFSAANQRDDSVKHAEDRMMMIISALDSILTVTTDYKLAGADSEDLTIVMQFYRDLVEMSDLWNILLFYIRSYDPTRFPRSFLAQLVCVNHKLFSAVEFYNQTSSSQLDTAVLQHIKQFATPKVIQQYTRLVESYATNTEQTNLAVFTMLCHICVDCRRMDLLYTPTLLRLLGGLRDNLKASEEDQQLATYITKSFLDDLSMRPQLCVMSFISASNEYMETDTEDNTKQHLSTSEWTDEEESIVFSAYAEWEEDMTEDSRIELVINRLKSSGSTHSKQEVKEKLRELGILDPDMEDDSGTKLDLSHLVTKMVDDGREDFICWIHQSMVTASCNKAMPKDSCSKNSPVCRYSQIQTHPYPLIPHSDRLSDLLSTDSKCRQLLEALQLPCEQFNGSYLPYIPQEKTAGQLYTLAEHLKSMETAAVGAKLPLSCDSSVASCCSTDEECFNVKSEFSTDPGSSKRELASGGASNIWLSYMRTTT